VRDTGARVVPVLEVVRSEWEDGYRRFQDLSRDRVAADRLSLQLAARYAAADEWVRQAVSERAPTPGWPRTLSIVQDAAFHLYQRGAVDYAP
jgi:hypothetical protein